MSQAFCGLSRDEIVVRMYEGRPKGGRGSRGGAVQGEIKMAWRVGVSLIKGVAVNVSVVL